MLKISLLNSMEVKLIDFGVAKSLSGTIARSCVGTTEIMAPELVSAKLMIAPKGAQMKKHGPFTFKPPQEPAEFHHVFKALYFKEILRII